MNLKLLTSDGELVRFEAVGKITRDGLGRQADPLSSLFGDGVYQHKCLISLSHSLYIDSTGVEWLLTAHQRFHREGGILILHSATPATKQLLRIMRMDLVLHIAANEREAVEFATQGERSNGNQH
jgi:anti-anti-sigma factor